MIEMIETNETLPRRWLAELSKYYRHDRQLQVRNLYLRLFGNPVLLDGADEHPFPAERRYQLLCYLACRNTWVPRNLLTALFWGNHGDEAARRNLRKLLHDIRRLPWLTGFETRGDSMRWCVPSDLAEFTEMLSRSEWGAAIDVVSGPLLDSMEHNATEPFHEWLRFEREIQLSRWREAMTNCRSEIREHSRERVELSANALRYDAHNEHAMKEMVDALCDIGADPALQLHPIGGGEFVAVNLQPCNELPSADPAKPDCRFIGRRFEQSELIALLKRKECRRVTLHGPGGVGKSSLARSAMRALAEEFPGGIFWVDLQVSADVAQIPSRIAEVCGFRSIASRDPVKSIVTHIGTRPMLLIFDNGEHLDGIGELSDTLVRDCAELKILHISRVRTGGAGEWMLPIEGLPVPDSGECELEVLRTFDAIQLFDACAREVEPRFELSRDMADVVGLVQIVEGLPLAIELAAACVRLMSVKEIAGDLRRFVHLQNPQRTNRDRNSAREQSLKACIDHSWQLLTQAEQAALARLAVFKYSFSLAAAQEVADANLAILASLNDKSLLRSDGDGRLSLHALIRQFALEHLTEGHEVHVRYAAYFARRMEVDACSGRDTFPGWHDQDVSNGIVAWQWAVLHGRLPLLQQMTIPMLKTLGSCCRWQEGSEIFGSAVASIEGRDDCPQDLLAHLLYAVSRCQLNDGKLRSAEENARRALRICRRLKAPLVVSGCLCNIGLAQLWRGDLVTARRFLEQSLRNAQTEQDLAPVARTRYAIAFLEEAAGNWAVARSLHRQNEVFYREKGFHCLLATTLHSLGEILLTERNMAEALACFDEGIEVCVTRNVKGLHAYLLTGRGLALMGQGDLRSAEKSIVKSLAVAQQWNMKLARIEAHLARSRLASIERDASQALAQLQMGMKFAWEIESPVKLLSAFLHWGAWLMQFGDPERGMAVLEYVRMNTMTPHMDREAAAEIIAMAPAGVKDFSGVPCAAAESSPGNVERDLYRMLDTECGVDPATNLHTALVNHVDGFRYVHQAIAPGASTQ